MLLAWIIIFIVSLAVLIKATDYFIEGAEVLGVYFNIKPFIIGVFVLSLGTSLPELAVSLVSMANEASEVVIGNVVGSNITNLFLVLGLAAFIVKSARVDYNFLDFDLPLFIATAFLLAVTAWNGIFTQEEGMLFLGIFLFYIWHAVDDHHTKRRVVPDEVKKIEEHDHKKPLDKTAVVKVLIAPIIIYLSAEYVVDSLIWLADFWGLGKELIAATAISLGSSLPEVAVSFASIAKGKIDEMLGNVVGSNIFNTLIVMGVPSLLGPIVVPDALIDFALPLMVVATLVTYVMIKDQKITRWEGMILLLLYGFFIVEMLNICLAC